MLPSVTVIADLEAFVTRHRPCGALTGDATPPTVDGYTVTVSCSCGAVFERAVALDDAMADLIPPN